MCCHCQTAARALPSRLHILMSALKLTCLRLWASVPAHVPSRHAAHACRFKQGSAALVAFSEGSLGAIKPVHVVVLQVTARAVQVEVDVEASEALLESAAAMQRKGRGTMRLDSRPVDNVTSRRQLDAIQALGEVMDGGNAFEVRSCCA